MEAETQWISKYEIDITLHYYWCKKDKVYEASFSIFNSHWISPFIRIRDSFIHLHLIELHILSSVHTWRVSWPINVSGHVTGTDIDLNFNSMLLLKISMRLAMETKAPEIKLYFSSNIDFLQCIVIRCGIKRSKQCMTMLSCVFGFGYIYSVWYFFLFFLAFVQPQ